MSNQHPADVILESSSVYWPTPNLSKATPHNAHSTPACVSQPSLGDALSCTFLDSTTDIRSKTYALRIVHGNSNPLLAKDIAQILQTSMTPAHVGRYANGEVNIQVLEPVRGDDCFIIQPTCGAKKQNSDSAVKSVSVNVNESLMELLLMIQTLRLASAKRITAVVPHFGYARQDRKTQARVPISASAVATMMATMGVDRVITMDLHCAQIQGFFQNIPVFDVSSASIFAQYIMHESNLDTQRVVVVAPDAGAVARARKLADMLHVPRIVTILKRRLCANKVESMQLVGEVKNAVCLIFDDMIDTAGTLCKAASVLVEWGAISVHAFATHGILTDPAISRITECTALTEVVVTDTIPQEEHTLRCPKLRVLSAARLIGEVIRRVHNEESFDNVESSVYDIPTRKSGSLGTDDEASAKCFLHHEIRK